jgi:hypothetical protein
MGIRNNTSASKIGNIYADSLLSNPIAKIMGRQLNINIFLICSLLQNIYIHIIIPANINAVDIISALTAYIGYGFC